MLQKSLLFFFCIFQIGCTEKLTTYSPDEGEVQWAQLDKNFIKAVVFFVYVQNDTLAVTASAEVSTRFGELDYYKIIDFNFEGLQQDSSRMDIILRDKDYNQIFQFEGSNLEFAIRQFPVIENVEDTLPVILTCERQYKLSSFPPKLQLNYRIVTKDTLVTGSTLFKAKITKTSGSLRWH